MEEKEEETEGKAVCDLLSPLSSARCSVTLTSAALEAWPETSPSLLSASIFLSDGLIIVVVALLALLAAKWN